MVRTPPRHRHPDAAAALGRAAIADIARRPTLGQVLDRAAVDGPARPGIARVRAGWQRAAARARAALGDLSGAARRPTAVVSIVAARRARARLRRALVAAEALAERLEEIAAGIAAASYAPTDRIEPCPRCGMPRPAASARCAACSLTTGNGDGAV